ncbi:probable isoleucine--tRNA ligase, cytoplasmic [Pseudomyrmex gracilis]|uniref:probable isoleucine--tRNA ligase, cytoplasmic n=1 Tax=Pseudomyrmex gracilis TaxID=219809 RepID=UPI000995252A|nr:probable isoleucine--tRNA ligase, cytoplasmic [Pseudomyrmex gracilis]
MQKLPETINFAEQEETTLELWRQWNVFQTSMRMSCKRSKFSFYDGPPFATGMPHYGHILAGTIKDIITRYAYQTGHHVERRFGWDCHGLPVENEIDKMLNIKGPDDVAKMGIAAYNNECRSIVMRYSEEWEKIIGRMGRWIDFQNDYKTMYPWYMESIWWIFKQLYLKGLVYEGIKVMPFSTACNTSLSNFEAGQNYKDVVDPSVVVAFPLVNEPGVSILAWTTTPWTLPSNLALCVNPTYEYVEVKDNKSDNVFIMLEAQLGLVFKSQDLYTIQGRRKGTDLKGKQYEPPFPYFLHCRTKGAFQVLNDTYVTAEMGTGIVHQAPYFGEDDYRCCIEAGIISKNLDNMSACPVDSSGCFIEPVHDFIGKYVKDADKDIIKYLLAKKRLIVSTTTKHSYPFCWRSDTPLIYKAVPSWFLQVEQIKDKLLEASSATYWVPDYVKEKRFGNWLRDARDWAISRNRYWGNPIPLWISEDREEIVCVGSLEELKQLTGVNVEDIHRENIDHLTIPSKRPGHSPLRRIPEVFDCWFESGSMPYAQMHYPFERQEDFNKCFPADFIAEGIDQTRGWFYTLLVISTALFGKAPFKNLVANGLILASDGQKMSKRKKNYPDPMKVVKSYGADALRLYLINSPVVRAENLRFKESGVHDIVKDVLLPWYNAFRFLIQNIELYETDNNVRFVFDGALEHNSDNIMDKWILSSLQSLLLFMKEEMEAYRLYTVVPRLLKFIENLTNWYLRMNRRRIKGDEFDPDKLSDRLTALFTLFRVLDTMIRMNAPFTPFLTEFMFQYMSKKTSQQGTSLDSIHFQMIPKPITNLIDKDIEKAVSSMQLVIEMGRIVRDRKGIPIKYPLQEIVVIHHDAQVLVQLRKMESYILAELNIKNMVVSTDKRKYYVLLRAEPDHKILGARLRSDFKQVALAIRELSDSQLSEFLVKKEIDVLGHKLGVKDLRLMYHFDEKHNNYAEKYETHEMENMLILMDVFYTKEMYNEGIAREVINRIQKLRKKAELLPSDRAVVYYRVENEELAEIIKTHKDIIVKATKTPLKHHSENTHMEISYIDMDIKEMKLQLALEYHDIATKSSVKANVCEERKISGSYVNVMLVDIEPRYGAKSGEASILISPRGFKRLTYTRLRHEIDLIFGLYGYSYDLYLADKKLTYVIKSPHDELDENLLNEQTIRVIHSKASLSLKELSSNRKPICAFFTFKTGLDEISVFVENPKYNKLSEAQIDHLTCLSL